MTTNEELVRRERARAPLVAVAVAVIVICYVGSAVVRGSIDLPSFDPVAPFLRAVEPHRSTLLITAIMQSLAFALLIIPLTFLFRACAARDHTVRRGFAGAVIAGPLFVAAALLLQQIGINQVASDFVSQFPSAGADATKAVENQASELQRNATLIQAALGLDLAGALGVVFAVVYTSQRAMRVGLMTRFWGTLGIIGGAAFGLAPIIGPLAFFGILIFPAWLVQLALLGVDRWPGRGSRPPAWGAGVAIPWPGQGRGAPPPQPAAEGDTVDGDGRPVESNGGPVSQSEVYPPTKPQRTATTNPPRQRGERKKRKRRT